MDKKENIVFLIKSLSKTEKRYFKLFVLKNSIGESSNYLKLFDYIEKTGTADKKTIQKRYGDNNFIQKQFRRYKLLLYKQILKSLRSYHSEGSTDDKIMELIRDIKILFDKALYAQASNVIEKAKSIAIKYENYTHLIDIIRWQKKIITAISISGETSKKEIIQIFQEEKQAVHKIDNANEYWKLSSLMYFTYRVNGVVRMRENINMYNTIIDSPFIKKPELAISFQAKRDFYATSTIYFIAVNNKKKAYTFAKKMLTLLEGHPHQIEDNPILYGNAHHNLLFITRSLKKYEEFFNLFPKLKAMLKRFQLVMNENIHSEMLLRSYNMEFSTYLDIGQFNKATLLIPEIEEVLKNQKNQNKLLELFFTMNISLLYFCQGKYKKSLTYLNVILNDNKNLRQDRYSFARIFQLMIHLEKENTDYLPYLVKSVYRYIMQKKNIYKLEAIFINFIKTKLHKINSKKDQIEAFKVLREELIGICDDPMEAKFLENFDIISWLDSKIENRPFEEILREKSGYVLNE